jgi:putative Holliday junction resolvase
MAFPGAALAIDVGSAKVGVAVSDVSRRLAFPLTTLQRRSVARDAAALARLAADRGVTALVVGMPDGGGRIAHLARQLGEALAAQTGLPIHFVDEGYTSSEARLRIDDAGMARTTVDAHAAALILEAWLTTVAAPEGVSPPQPPR